MTRWDLPMAGVIGLVLWEILVRATGVPSFILPSPTEVAFAAWESRALLAEHAIVTATEVLAGLILGTILGVQTAITIVTVPLARRFLLPILVFTQAVPVFALAPVLTLWLGYGITAKIVMAVLIIYFPVTSAFHDGLTRIDRGYLDLARTMGANPQQMLLRIRVPLALPSLGSGLRLAAVYAPIGAVIGEWVGASRGLGYLMLLANGRAKIDLMFAALFVLAIFAVLLHRLVGWGADRLDRYARPGHS